jgi:hypothetical protein
MCQAPRHLDSVEMWHVCCSADAVGALPTSPETTMPSRNQPQQDQSQPRREPQQQQGQGRESQPGQDSPGLLPGQDQRKKADTQQGGVQRDRGQR